MSTLTSDLKHGLRQLRHSPGFFCVAVLSLALGIGANTAMFSLVDVFLLKPLPLPHAQELRQLHVARQDRADGYRFFSYQEYQTLRQDNPVFRDLLAHQMTMVGMTEGETTRRAFADLVSANFFSVLEVRVTQGRDFRPEEEENEIPVAIVSDACWQRLGADPSLVGKSILLNGLNVTVIGIAPPGFTGTMALLSPDVWLPLGLFDVMKHELMLDGAGPLHDPATRHLALVGRLQPTADEKAIQPSLDVSAARLTTLSPQDGPLRLEAHALPRFIGGPAPQSTAPQHVMAVTLLAMSGIVLVITCMNLAHLLLARATARQREMAMRMALGAGRVRILRQCLLEGLLLSVAGSALAMVLALWVTDLLVATLVWRLPMTLSLQTGLDGRLLMATLGFGIVATLGFSLLPGLRLARLDPLSALRACAASGWGRRRGWRRLGMNQLLVTGQLTFSLALLSAAGLFVRSALNAASADAGFQLRDGILIEMDAGLADYDETQGRTAFSRIEDRLRALPGVDSVSLAATVPFGVTHLARHVQSVDRVPDGTAIDGEGFSHFNAVGADYFTALGIPLLRGRPFSQAEVMARGRPSAIIIDDLLARRLWPDADPIGRQVRFKESEDQVLEVVGVVPWTRDNLSGGPPRSHVYVPFGQSYQANAYLHVRTAAATRVAEQSFLKTLREEIRAVDPRLPLLSVKPLQRHFTDSPVLWMFRAGAALFTGLGVLGLGLASVGLYGLRSYLVSRRTREFGIRLALGAQGRSVVWSVVLDGLRTIVFGLVGGLLLSLAIGQALRQMLFEVGTADPMVIVCAAVLLLGVGLLACWIPARRAARVDPMEALRYE